MFARSSTKSMDPLPIFSSRLARASSSTNGVQPATAPWGGEVLGVGREGGGGGEVEDLGGPARARVPAVGVAPGDRALVVQLLGDLLEVVPVVRRVPVVVVPPGFPGGLAEVLGCHGAGPFVAGGVQETVIACSGQERAASSAPASWPAGIGPATAAGWPSISLSSNRSGARIAHSVCPWHLSGSTWPFMLSPRWARVWSCALL